MKKKDSLHQNGLGETRDFFLRRRKRTRTNYLLNPSTGHKLSWCSNGYEITKKIMKLQKELNKAFDEAQDELKEETTLAKQIAQSSAQRLLMIKQKHEKKC